ncbi:sugar kinase [Flammeovirga sp. MY04]|uniref:sugar kinase n=1 Tax=Flammeovirga sp. MY04 TaxID=1191459 RepID=UPI000806132B|nr:sugar kinase [Flammeovirga sp. MY04]ANQ49912.1 sugar kinase [Flammeovirga sp. MY04]
MKKIVTFGEVLLNLAAQGDLRLKQSNCLDLRFAGAESNVAASLAQFGEDVSYITRVPKNDLSEKVINTLRGLGVDTSKVVYGGDRIGIIFFENGAVYRSSKVIYDRAGSSIATIEEGSIDWKAAFEGADWFHWTGITPALSASAAAVTKEALVAAREMGLTISGDYNFRKNLWQWGKDHTEVMPELLGYCDVMSGIHPDVNVVEQEVSDELYALAGEDMMKKYPNCKVVAFTARGSISASHNTWQGVIYDGEKVYRSANYDITHIVDRVGGGDSFMAALIYGLRNYSTKQEAVEFAAAASTLKHLIAGDQNMVTVDEVEALMNGPKNGLINR